MSHDAFTQERWDRHWAESDATYDPAADPELRDSLALVNRFWPQPSGRFLEAGCGLARIAVNLAARGVDVAGVDSSHTAVEAAARELGRRSLEAELVVADVRRMPFPDESFDFVYVGGVVEHFHDTDRAVVELARVLRPGGRLLVTVPALTFAYPYLFLRGNVPAVRGVEDVVAAIHLRLLRGRLATYGYERSFTRRRLERLLAAAGFADVEVGRFDTHLPLRPVPRPLRNVARRLARTDAFAPMYYASATRSLTP